MSFIFKFNALYYVAKSNSRRHFYKVVLPKSNSFPKKKKTKNFHLLYLYVEEKNFLIFVFMKPVAKSKRVTMNNNENNNFICQEILSLFFKQGKVAKFFIVRFRPVSVETSAAFLFE